MVVADQIISYANAVFALTKDKKKQELYYQQIYALDAMNSTNPNFAKILSTRSIDREERKELAQIVLSGYGFEKEIIYWVWTIIDNNFYSKFNYIAAYCRDLYYNLFNIATVKVTSASELNEQQVDKIKNFFEKKLKRQIRLDWVIKPDLIGGLIIQVNNKTYDNSYKAKLDDLKKQLLSKKG